MKKITLIITILLISLIPRAYSEIIDRVVAIVNDDVITQSEIDMLLRPWFEQFKNTYTGQDMAIKLNEMRRNLLNQLIEDRLVYQEAKKRNIEISDAEVNERIDDFKRRFKSEADLTRMLTAQGITINKLKEKYRQQLSIRRLNIMEIRNKVLVSPKEIEDYFHAHQNEFNQPEKIKLSSITIRKSQEKQGKKDEDAKAKADQILTDLKKGADFSKIAQAHSEDHNAPSGGDLGYVGRGELARDIDEIIFALKPGELSPVIETSIGYHIFKVEERQEGKKRTLEEVRKDIQEILFREKAKSRFDVWVKELKGKAYISIR